MMKMLGSIIVLTLLLALAGCASKRGSEVVMEDPVAMARQALAAGVIDEAEQRFRAHLVEHPEDVDALAGLGFVQLDRQQHDNALATFRQALEINAGHREAREGQALVNLARGQTDLARPVLQSLGAEDPVSWRVLNGLGVLADLDGEFARSRDYYQRAIAAGGDNVVVANNLGYSTMMAGDAEAAISLLSEARRRYPQETRLQQNLGLAQARAGRYDVAVDTLSALMPEWEAFNNVGYMAMLNDQLSVARRYLQRALDSSPRHYPQAAANLERVEAMIAVGQRRSLQQ
jgi:Flp pilus assembly protein TadD